MNLYLLVVFLKTANNYMDNQFALSTVTLGFKLFAYLLTGVLSCHIVLLRVSWEGFLNLDFLNGFKKKHIMENIILMHGEALLLILGSLNVLLNFQTYKVLTCFR